MILLRLLNGQGVAGLAASLCLALLLVVQKGETRHWYKQSDHFQILYKQTEAARAETVASYRQASADAEAADRAAADRVTSAQDHINHRSDHALQSRLADVRARAQRLRVEAGSSASDYRRGGAPALPAVSAGPGGLAQATGEDGFSVADRETATEQAIQLDELILWVRRQGAIDPNAGLPAAP